MTGLRTLFVVSGSSNVYLWHYQISCNCLMISRALINVMHFWRQFPGVIANFIVHALGNWRHTLGISSWDWQCSEDPKVYENILKIQRLFISYNFSRKGRGYFMVGVPPNFWAQFLGAKLLKYTESLSPKKEKNDTLCGTLIANLAKMIPFGD